MNTESKIYEYEEECRFKSLMYSNNKARFGESYREKEIIDSNNGKVVWGYFKKALNCWFNCYQCQI